MTLPKDRRNRAYRTAITGSGTRDDPFRPLLPVALRMGDGWSAQTAYAGGAVEVTVTASDTIHQALEKSSGIDALADTLPREE